MIMFLTAHHFAGTQWEGRNCCGYSYTCHTYKLCTEYEYRNMLWAIHGTLSKHLKPARHRSQHPDDKLTKTRLKFASPCIIIQFK